MPFARYNFAITDEAGDIVDGATVTVTTEFSGALPQLFSDFNGAIGMDNPFVAADGADAGFNTIGGHYRIDATKGAFSRTWRYIPIGLAQGSDVLGLTPVGAYNTGSPSTTYHTGHLVTHDGRLFASKVDDNTGNVPPTADEDDAFWMFVPVVQGVIGEDGEGLDFDAHVDDIAARAAYEGEVAGFRVLVDDTGDGRAAIYSLLATSPPSWQGPAYVTGADGDTGATGVSGADGTTTTAQNDEPSTTFPAGSLWIDADSDDADLYVLTGSPLAWVDTGINMQGADGANGANGSNGADGADGSTIVTQNDEPATTYPAGSLWIDADSTDGDLYVLTGSPLAWVDTGINMQAADGAAGADGLFAGTEAFETSLVDTDELYFTRPGSPGGPRRILVGDVDFGGSVGNTEANVNIVNGYLDWSVDSNALTAALKTNAGNDPSAGDPVWVRFRSVTVTDGAPEWVAVTAPLSVTVPSGGTLGFVNGYAARVYATIFNDGGTLRLGVIKTAATSLGKLVSLYRLRGWGIASSTAVGTGSDSSQIFYTDSAVTAKAYTVIGWASWESGLTAGTWVAPTREHLWAPGDPLPGDILQIQRDDDGEVATGTTTVPLDDSAPTSSEGTQFLSDSITPTSAANLTRVEAQVYLAHSVGSNFAAFLLNGTTTVAVAPQRAIADTVHCPPPNINYVALAATTSTITFNVRAGSSSAGTTTFNGRAGSRDYGGLINSYIELKEIMT
jgi:hypothetical protein